MKKRWFVLLLIAVLLTWAGRERRMLAIYFLALTEGGEVAPLLDKADEGPDVRWQDDYFTVQPIAPNTFAIGEPRFWQQNYCGRKPDQ
jgi:hypothetical protein